MLTLTLTPTLTLTLTLTLTCARAQLGASAAVEAKTKRASAAKVPPAHSARPASAGKKKGKEGHPEDSWRLLCHALAAAVIPHLVRVRVRAS